MDLTTQYLGLELRSPIVASAGPATGDHALVESLVAAGVAAVVLPSLFEEEVLHEEMELRAALERGADGIVLFNRFYQPDLDLETLEVVPKVDLSQPWELRLPLRWLAILRPLIAGRASLAATTGIHSGADVAKALLVGADVAMMTSALLRQGPNHVRAVEDELRAWMADHDYGSVDQLRGSVSHATTDNPAAFERAHYLRTLHSWAAPQTA